MSQRHWRCVTPVKISQPMGYADYARQLETPGDAFLASQAISLFGSALVQLAIIWHITLTTQSGSMMTLSIICGFLPTLFVSPFAGVWADRYDRKVLIVLADSLTALCTLILAVLFLAGFKFVWLLFVASAIRSLGAGIQMPAVNAFLPQFVPQENLTKVNAINGTIQSSMTLLSPMLSATLLTVASIEAIFFIDVVTAAIAIAILLAFLRVPAPERSGATEHASYFGDMRDGLAYVAKHGYLKAFLFFNAVFFTFMGPLEFLTPLQIARTYGEEVWRLSAIEVSFSLGMLVGGVVMASWGGFSNWLHSMALAVVTFGVCAVGLGLPPAFGPYVFLMGVAGLVVPMFNTPATVMLQERVEGAFLGRIFGINTMIASSLMPLSMLVYGPLADVIPIERLLSGTGMVLVVQGLLMLANRALRRAGRPILVPAAE